MQEAASAAIREHKNVLLLSPTGSGKTLAFVLPMLEVVDACSPFVQTAIIVPSRELAIQIDNVIKQQVKEKGFQLKTVALYGGRPAMEEHAVLKQVSPQVVICTPGRLLDHIDKGNLTVERCSMLIVDEYDKCMELGFRDEMDRIGMAFCRCPQLVLTSATTTDEKTRLVETREFEVLDFLDGISSLQERLSTHIVPSKEKDKLETLARLLTYLKNEQSIVFVAHRESAERIGKYLKEQKFAAVVYHGGMEQERRERALYRFRSEAATILVSTDLAARGLDIPSVRHIIHYHLPLDEATFTHRVGRTARWEDTGAAYLIKGPDEPIPAFVPANSDEICVDEISIHASQPKWTLLYIGRGKKDKLSRADVLGFLCKKGGLTAAQIGRIDLAPHAAYVAVSRTAVKLLLQQIANEKIKGMRTIIEPIRH